MTDTESPTKLEVIEGMARAFYATSYVCAAQNGALPVSRPIARPHENWLDIIGETSRDSQFYAGQFAALVEQVNGASIEDLVKKAMDADRITELQDRYAWWFGFYIVLEAFQSGESWFEEHERFPMIIPRSEYTETIAEI